MAPQKMYMLSTQIKYIIKFIIADSEFNSRILVLKSTFFNKLIYSICIKTKITFYELRFIKKNQIIFPNGLLYF